MNVTALGAGLVGAAMVQDLAQEEGFRLTVVDRDPGALARLAAELPVRTVQADLRAREDFSELLADCKLVVCAVPGFMGFETLKKVIQAGKDVVDISFCPEDPFELDGLARERKVTAVVDCGVAPGLCNVLAGHVEGLLDRLERYACYVGGLPRVRCQPYEYKAPFSPADVLEEYTRPVHLVEHGQPIVRPALSEVELLDFPGVGTLEAFNTDGLRTLRRTLPAPFMVEKTLRYPGHAALMRALRDSGFFDQEPLELDGVRVAPRALSSRLLFERWRLEPGEEDLTVLRVIVEGEKDGQRLRYTYDLLDRYDRESRITSMARTTGYTCTLVARQLARGLIRTRGVCPPEWLGADPACFQDLLAGYAQRGIRLKESARQI